MEQHQIISLVPEMITPPQGPQGPPLVNSKQNNFFLQKNINKKVINIVNVVMLPFVSYIRQVTGFT